MYAAFAELGARLEEAHRAAHHDEDAFAELSREAVAAAAMHERFDLAALVEEVLRHARTLDEAPNPFGQPPITVYRGRAFYIEILFWLEATTAIHQHGFTGTFQVISGSSLHTTYEWTTERTVSSRLEIGRARRVASEILRRGDAHVILAGDRFVHALFHLEHPSVSMVVRTYGDERRRPQYSYHLPCLRVDPFHEHHGQARKVRLLRMLAATGSPHVGRAVATFVASSSFPDVYTLLAEQDPESVLAALVAAEARRRHPDLAARAEVALEEIFRQRFLVQKRNEITRAEHRFLLALLLNLRTRAEILAHVGAAHPGRDPRDLVAAWVDELTSAKPLLGFELTADMRRIFRLMLDGLSGAALVARLRADYDLSRRDVEAVRGLEAQLAGSRLFRTLFAEDDAPISSAPSAARARRSSARGHGSP
jgi:hypothetical protein